MKLRHLLLLLVVSGLCLPVYAQTVRGPKSKDGERPVARQSNTQSANPAYSNNSYANNGTTYGPINSNDTLWSIAQRHSANSNYSIYQVMVAIQQMNPTAFENGNMNLMIDGKVLTLPPDSYIATIDPAMATAKATFDLDNSSQGTATKKPNSKIASTADLNETKESIEKQITSMDEQRHQQFVELKGSLAESIRGLESLLSENNRINERLDGVNTEIDHLRSQVGENGEVPQQINRLLALQNEVLKLSQQERAKQLEEEKRNASLFSNPLWLILASTIPVILILVGLGVWLKRRQSGSVEAPVAKATEPAAEDLPDAAADMDEFSTSIDDDLSGELFEDDLFGSDDLQDASFEEDELLTEPATTAKPDPEDDVDDGLNDFDDLTDELLDESLDMEDISSDEPEKIESEDIDDDLDESLDIEDEVLNEVSAIEAELGEEILQQGDLDDLFDSDDEEPLAEPGGEEVDDVDDLLDQIESDDSEESVELSEELKAAELQTLGEDDEAEVEKQESNIEKINDALEETDLTAIEMQDISRVTPIADGKIDNLAEEIGQNSAEIDSLTQELLDDIEQAPDESAEESIKEQNADTKDEENSLDENGAVEEPEQDDLSDELLAELGVEAKDEEDSLDEDGAVEESVQDDLSDELLAELGVEAEDEEDSLDEESAVEESAQDDLSDELLAELGVEAEDEEDSLDEDGAVEEPEQDDLSDELLAELGVEAEDEEDSLDEESAAEESAQDDLSDELLAELGVDAEDEDDSLDEESVQDDLSDELLAELGVEAEDEEDSAVEESVQDDLSDELLAELGVDAEDEDDSLDEDSAVEESVQDDLSDELLAELGVDAEDEDDSLDEESVQDDLSDELLAELGVEAEAEDEIESQDDEVEAEAEELTDELLSELVADADETLPTVDEPEENDLLDELEDELEQEIVEDDELESALAEFEQAEDDPEPIAASDDSAELVDDIELVDEDELESALDDFDEPTEAEKKTNQAVESLDDVPGLGDWLDKDDRSSSADTTEKIVDKEQEKPTDAAQAESSKPARHALEDDIPGLGDWLGDDDLEAALADEEDDEIHDDAVLDGIEEVVVEALSEDDELLEELENSSFDDMLEEMEHIEAPSAETKNVKATLDNPDLDIEALLSDSNLDAEDDVVDLTANTDDNEFVDVDELLSASDDSNDELKNLDIDLASLGMPDIGDIVDVDGDHGLSAKMDLALAYMEIEDHESALPLLQQVAESDDKAQAKEAKKLLKKIK
ncbi:FimV/HubP family polar landmark protein [Alteromonadaceae bacterium BrNp21-10]|nr:FimV/HubP family polar landmark protein [Alteromonadaceae bacterium BrNp21-10]